MRDYIHRVMSRPYMPHRGVKELLAGLAFNRAAGFTAAHDRLPEFFRREALPPFDLAFDVPQEEMERVFEWGRDERAAIESEPIL